MNSIPCSLLVVVIFTLLGLSDVITEARGRSGNDQACEYTCPNNNEKPWLNSKHEFTSNGCGSGGISVVVEPKLVECCDIHDACYGICGISRDYCDNMFEKCLMKKCGNDDQCKGNASIMKLGTNMFGCSPFLQGQRQGCQCLNTENSEYNDAVLKSFTNYYKKLGDIDSSYGKTDDEINQLIEKYSGKEEKLLFGIVNKYPKQMIRREKDASDINSKIEL